MKCFVYKSVRRADSYIYLTEKDDFDKVPEQLLHIFGKPEFALEFDLTVDRKLAVADAAQVIQNIEEQGYYLQMPSNNSLPI